MISLRSVSYAANLSLFSRSVSPLYHGLGISVARALASSKKQERKRRRKEEREEEKQKEKNNECVLRDTPSPVRQQLPLLLVLLVLRLSLSPTLPFSLYQEQRMPRIYFGRVVPTGVPRREAEEERRARKREKER